MIKHSPKTRSAALDALRSGDSYQDVSERLGVNCRTLRSWAHRANLRLRVGRKRSVTAEERQRRLVARHVMWVARRKLRRTRAPHPRARRPAVLLVRGDEMNLEKIGRRLLLSRESARKIVVSALAKIREGQGLKEWWTT